MPTTLRTVVLKYLRAGRPARGTRDEYRTTLKKWKRWDGGVPIEKLGRKEIREFLEWVHERALAQKGLNPGRTANKAREHLRAVSGLGVGTGSHRFAPPIPEAEISSAMSRADIT